jgi:uncharacterized membrane protein
MRYARRTYAALLCGGAFWCFLIVLPAFLSTAGEGGRTVSRSIFTGFHLVCHQLDDRSYHLLGTPLAVCSRCASIYFAFLAGTIAYPFLRNSGRNFGHGTGKKLRRPGIPDRWFIVIAVLPMLLDVLLGASGFHEVTNLSRTITGTWFGFLLPALVIPGLTEGVEEIMTKPPTLMVPPEKGLEDA